MQGNPQIFNKSESKYRLMIGPLTRETQSNDFQKVYALNLCNTLYCKALST